MSRHKLCTSLIGLAEWTRRVLRNGYRAGIYVGEESLTDFALIKVANRNPRYVRTRKFTRTQEGQRTGADWLWLFGSENEAWMPLLVQAKVMHPGQRPRAMLSYRNGLQNRLLLEFALEYRLFPAYCIYNPVTDEARQNAPPLRCGLGIEQYACALLTLSQRQELLGSYKALRQPHVLARAVPLASLVCCMVGEPDELAFQVARILAASDRQLEERELQYSELEAAVVRTDPREMMISGSRVEEFIAQIEEASAHSATGGRLVAGVVQFSSSAFG
jgi:hypothetical protein